MATDWSGLTATIKASIVASTEHALDLSTVLDPLSVSEKFSPSFGSGDNAVDEIWHDRRTLAASANEDLDLAGVLKNARNQTVTFAKVKYMLVINTSDVVTTGHGVATDAQMEVGGAAATQFLGPFKDATDKIVLEVGDCFLVTCKKAGWTVTGGSVDSLRITNTDGADALQYDIVLIGTST